LHQGLSLFLTFNMRFDEKSAYSTREINS